MIDVTVAATVLTNTPRQHLIPAFVAKRAGQLTVFVVEYVALD